MQLPRDGRAQEVEVQLTERPPRDAERGDAQPAQAGDAGDGARGIGLTVQELTRQVRSRLKLPDALSGVLVARVTPLSPADDADLRHGDVIIEVNRTPVRTAGDYRPAGGGRAPRRRADLLRLRSGNRPARAALRCAPSASLDTPATPMKPRILVIDDEAAIRDSMRMILEYEGYDFLGAATGEDGIALVERESVDLVFLDIKMPGMDGLEVLGRLKAVGDQLPVVMISGHGTVATAVEATKLGAFDFIEKPLATERILLTIRNALGFSRLRDENQTLARAIDLRHDMVGSSPVLRGVLETVRRAAPTSATVLIRGESGVGKELVARMIHRNSLRARERFVQVNCAAIPDELIESELFGHEKGSFTGATDKQVGKFELADRGTIFLDEVGDMSLKTQAKVLRVLQEGEVERLGSSRTLKVDVRVIAATNKDLEEEIEQGTVPRGPVLPAERDSHLRAAAARTARTTSRRWSATSPTSSRARTTSGRSASRPTRSPPCSASAGRATCANCATPSSASSS